MQNLFFISNLSFWIFVGICTIILLAILFIYIHHNILKNKNKYIFIGEPAQVTRLPKLDKNKPNCIIDKELLTKNNEFLKSSKPISKSIFKFIENLSIEYNVFINFDDLFGPNLTKDYNFSDVIFYITSQKLPINRIIINCDYNYLVKKSKKCNNIIYDYYIER